MAKGFGNKQKKSELKRRDYLDFLRKILWAIRENKPDITRKILEDNLDKLDHNFPSILRDWATETLSNLETDKAYKRAIDISNFSKKIHDIPEINPIKNAIYIEIATVGYEVALLVLNHDDFPEKWASIQNNIGEIYRNKIIGDCKENLEQAVNRYKSALAVLKSECSPELCAAIHNNLGVAYIKLRSINLAIKSLEKALEIFSSEMYIKGSVSTLNNLDIAYIDIDKTNIEASIHHNLGAAYIESKNIEAAINSLKIALQIDKYESNEQDWAETQNNLGLAYLYRSQERQKDDLQLAINYFDKALEVLTMEACQKQWAETQNNLGLVYYNLDRFPESIKVFQNAIKIKKISNDYLGCLKIGDNLGKTAFKLKRWTEAIEGYSIAIEALETSRSWIKSESRRQEIIEESIDIYQNIVQACINIGQIDKAFEYSERSRSKRLVDLMASNNFSQSANIPPKVQELLQQYEELQQLIDAERQNHKSENNRSETRAVWQAYNEKIASLEVDKQQIWENLRREDPVLAGEIQVNPLSLSEIQQLIDHPNTAILGFYTTNTDTHIFIVRKDRITLHTCTGEGLETFQNWIVHNWLLPYKEYIEKKSKKWESQIETILHEISQRLQLSEIINQHLKGIEELIIEPHLLLHQIPFAALPTGEYQESLVDKFLIRYTPSCQILDFCHQRPNIDIQSLEYGTVEDATDDLYCARWEGEQIAKMYNIPVEKRLIGSSQATRENYRQLAEQVQILHSCHHAESCLYNPLESQLKLADGTITLGQLMSPGWRLPNLVDVFLSCCETNLGTTPLTDDILTLSTGFLCAGARSVVSSLWSVDDLATSLFSIFYYQQRQQGKNRPESLKQAQIKLRELRKADLAEISNQINEKEKEKELIGNRQQYNRNSVEYSKWEDQYNTHAKINRLIKQKLQISEPEFPFSHPRYWAAFICHGLR
ncbi:CHAT domain-containing protein [Anabaena cylindrica FACHB-243]|uniref:Tetratricopeptide TPR_1 repeat-containing protein n=1 Tax=Anabaena cylindrica (strain ATCC 27899 / PCC 7122) TaxID=272123 RepID=K9ZFG6_ANACC|nr:MULTISPECIES: CHAT domain-containing protein [Anabaena]AFZ57963.1 Tetratricopeptide TPR_1 repeat-containing protein [Anabaena cylindrica PCC 7122]MBD2420789.1 CHAT domain-containing protein [Anabaena cylindrica FACHB-243]MBY5282696.1 CHAT domain-containing protein [Anabaena sp. CCAP 1446/1C]MBY5307130.1 CHAT domain-containing protein [Anabaena sp. CCAP 1446/1C]MCM2408191.1 CHAT domain-containing protein [Anabaena sp. CCAP 1446/1C]